MKRLLTILLLVFTTGSASAQHTLYLDSAKAFLKKGKVPAAEGFLTSYLNIFAGEVSHTDTTYANALRNVGEVLLYSRDKERALSYFLKEKEIRESHSQNSTLDYARLKHNLGKVYYRLADYKNAQDNLFNALLIVKKAKGEKCREYSSVLSDLASLFISKGNFLLAEKMFERNSEIIKDVIGKESIEFAGNIEKLGYISQVKGNFQAAEVYYQMAEKIYHKEKGFYSEEYGNNMVLQGQLYYQLGQYTAAEALLRKSIHIFHKSETHDTPEAVHALQNLAVLNMEMSNESQANELLTIAKNFNKEYYTEFHPEYGKSLKELGKVYLLAGYPKAAQPFLEEAKMIFDSVLTTKHFEYTLTLSDLAEVYKANGDFENAEKLYWTALDTFKLTMGDRNADYARLQSNLGNLYHRIGNYEKAIGMHQQAIEIRSEILNNIHPDYIQSTKDMSLIYWAAGKDNKAKNFFRKSSKSYIGQYQRYFAFLSEKEKTGFYEGIQSHFMKHNNYVLQRMTKDPILLGEMFDNQIATKSVLFHTTKEIRQNIFGGDSLVVDKYHRWIRYKEILSKLYKLERDELQKRGLLLDSLEEVTNYLEKEISLRVELANEKTEDHILSTSWKEIRHKLHENEAAIEIIRINEFLPDSGGHFTDKVIYAALIITKKTKNHPEIVVLENGNELEGRYLNYYRNAIQLNLQDGFSYDKYWKPIKESPALAGIETIFFSPDGVYNQINLNTLIDPASNLYVLDERDIHVVSNTRDVHSIKKVKSSLDTDHLASALLIGFPDYDRQGSHEHVDAAKAKGMERGGEHLHVRGGVNDLFRGGQTIVDLPGTKVEVNSISQIFKDNNEPFEMYLGNDALEERIKDDKHFYSPPRILHIATHGFFMEDNHKSTELSESDISRSAVIDSIILNRSNDNPLLQSGIMLAGAAYAYSDETLLEEIYAILNGDEYEDGILTAYEAMNLNLNETELVVLSACETGLGVVKNGEGVYGLQRAFQTAGANSVVMSLWKVNDEATQNFMIEFYDHWMKNGDKRAAFRHAQLKIREKFNNPKYWGAFVMIGE